MATTPQIPPVSAPPLAVNSVRPGAHKLAGSGVKTKSADRFGNLSDLSVPLAVLGIVMAMIAPLPSFLLDILISANITVSVIVLLVSMYITRPVEFSVFPTSLLLLTLFRLALNISSSRLILIHGNTATRERGPRAR
jgi:flagellar biosynthesis protein FlhA